MRFFGIHRFFEEFIDLTAFFTFVFNNRHSNANQISKLFPSDFALQVPARGIVSSKILKIRGLQDCRFTADYPYILKTSSITFYIPEARKRLRKKAI